MRKTALVWLLPALVVSGNWLRLEESRPGGGRVALVLALALAPALLPRRLFRLVAAVPAALLGAAVAFEVSLLAVRPFDGDAFFGAIVDRAQAGLREFYDVGLPFVAQRHPDMHGLVVFAVFAFALAMALAIAERQALLACLALVAGAAWPATLVGGENELTRGAVILAGALVVLAGLRGPERALRPALLGGAVVLLAATVVSTSPSIARGGLLEWQTWNPYSGGRRVSVDYVWRGQYAGIRFPDEATTVFEVEASDDARYWRSTTLNSFVEDAWEEAFEEDASVNRGGRDELIDDGTMPEAAGTRSRWLRQRVEIEALADDYLPAASVPVAYDPGDVNGVVYGSGGLARATDGLERGDSYTVWSYAAQPPPRALGQLTADYPATITSGPWLSVGIFFVPPFGTPGRDAEVVELLRSSAELSEYEPLYRTAQRVVGQARTPYAAAVALETWFRQVGGFAYNEQPRVVGPPLVGFVTRTKEGYCQHFAGAMALMLRYLGIPARVAAGFTSGSYNGDRKRWVVTDFNAHTWVEVWFPRFGWLPFDPTPGRGTFDAPYTNASLSFDAGGALAQVFGAGTLAERTLERLRREQLEERRNQAAAGESLSARDRGGDGPGFGLPGLVLLGLLGGATLLGLVKAARRRLRYLTTDPRRLAGACRRELAEFVTDQRVVVPAGATLTELADLIRGSLGLDPRRFVAAASAARFGPPGQAGTAARQARTELRALRRALRRHLTVGERIRGVVSLRSLRLGA